MLFSSWTSPVHGFKASYECSLSGKEDVLCYNHHNPLAWLKSHIKLMPEPGIRTCNTDSSCSLSPKSPYLQPVFSTYLPYNARKQAC